jgi:iron-sulfur cluster insertion protein
MDAPTLTPAAAARVALIARKQGKPAALFRLGVEGGGCSGFQYRFELAEAAEPDDIAVITDGVTLLVDETALPFVAGASVDYVEALGGSSFQVKNPVATAGCGCGSSFAV